MKTKRTATRVYSSTHKWDYIWVGLCHFRTPHRVYEICHTEELYDECYRGIVRQLVRRNVVQNRLRDFQMEDSLKLRMQSRL